LERLYNWLAPADDAQECDAIFVLAGRECRKLYGLQLLQEGWAAALLLSVGRFEIRRFSRLRLPVAFDLMAIARASEPRLRHYFVRVDSDEVQCEKIATGRFGTLTEICAFSKWLEANPVRAAMVVSSGFHLRRIRMCCERLVDGRAKLIFVAVPDEGEYFRSYWWRDAKSRRLVLSELIKIVVYGAMGPRLMARMAYQDLRPD
jgi:hypothetical protein